MDHNGKSNIIESLGEENDRLKRENIHQRDYNISFYKDNHKYLISRPLISSNSNTELTVFDHGYTSVTTHLEDHFDPFDDDSVIAKMMAGRQWKEGHKWWGWSRENLKIEWERIRNEASFQGEVLHAKIEAFMNNDNLPYPYTFSDLLTSYNSNLSLAEKETENLKKAWIYFLNFVKDYSYMQPYRTEWRIYHEEARIAGSIDLLCKILHTNCYILFDWKMSKKITIENERFPRFSKTEQLGHVPDTNFYHYALQQNMYRIILKEKYEIVVNTMYLVQLHPDLNNYELIEVPDMTKEINEIFKLRSK
jgi:hypothetical protein